MKKLSYLAFCLVLVAGFGCAVTNYGTIVDNDQVANGQGSGVVNTAGKAHLIESSQIATIWPDGTDELFSMIDQKADGTATITTYNNFSTGGFPTFHDDMYCNAAWSGCAIFTAPDDNVGSIFDGSTNTSCAGVRSLSVLLSSGRYYGECGSAEARLSVQDKIGLIDSAVAAKAYGRNGLLWNLDSRNTTITAKNLDNGLTVNVPLFGTRFEHFFANRGNTAVTWLDHPMTGLALRNFSSQLGNELNSSGIEVTLTHNGISTSFTMAGGAADYDVRGAFAHKANSF